MPSSATAPAVAAEQALYCLDLALAINVGLEGELRLAIASDTIAGLALACVGMWIGQTIRLRMSPADFRKWFFIGLMALGLYLAVRSLL